MRHQMASGEDLLPVKSPGDSDRHLSAQWLLGFNVAIHPSMRVSSTSSFYAAWRRSHRNTQKSLRPVWASDMFSLSSLHPHKAVWVRALINRRISVRAF
jgi:hypothetical protein